MLQPEARALGDPTRYAIFSFIQEADGQVGVRELTAQFGLNHNGVRQHLGKLVAAGLLVETTVQRGGRGRPSLAYEVDPEAASGWGSEGPYERLSRMLVEMVRTGDTAQQVGRRAGRAYTASRPRRSDTLAAIADAMARFGFRPVVRRRSPRAATAEIVLQTCPFAAAVLTDPDVVCTLHLGLAEGMAAGTDVTVLGLDARDPRRAGCRLKVRAAATTP